MYSLFFFLAFFVQPTVTHSSSDSKQMSILGLEPHQISNSIREQDEYPGLRTNPLTDLNQQQTKQKTSKRLKGGDDSFEYEHRLANGYNLYFNSGKSRMGARETTDRTISNTAYSTSRHSSFPPFFDLQRNEIGEQGAQQFGEALKTNQVSIISRALHIGTLVLHRHSLHSIS